MKSRLLDAGQTGARPDSNHTDDSAYLEHTRTVPSNSGPVRLPSDRFAGGGQALTPEAWRDAFADAYPQKAVDPSEPEFWA